LDSFCGFVCPMAFGTSDVRQCRWVHPHLGICRGRCIFEKGHSRPKISRPILEAENMKPVTLVGILLVILGALALAYQGISYTRQEKIIDVGPIHATAETHKRIPLPPILGGLMLVGGVSLLVMGARQKS